ncbi:molecular chaperone HtpG [Candidatus Deianiraea vastatrix]|uniref:Chaperone protein HtpG n=1 Tax=Candidatus Deianiraea vastatrix TaxID=2163644 RepID=A0A5B8XEX5_9RICK|nr:molecular chaperone HtpG [Candidatus Deianiraea vastatrix]QED23823.1 Chaperone protein HtpG [Candidatus Deianiraea vastatrix]
MSEVKSFNAEISRVLDIMINSLYTNKDVFLRELISNASDACEKLRHASLFDQNLLGDDTDLTITVEIDREKNAIVVRDNGIGMTKEDMIEHLGTIAKSGTGEFIKQLSSSNSPEKMQDMIGQFGVGFYSSFMVAQNVEVISKKAGVDGVYLWKSDGKNTYEVAESEEKIDRGTKITLYLKDDFKEQYLDKFKIKNIIESYSNHITVPIFLKHEEKIDEVKINKQVAIWARAKKDIKDEEYTEFFRSLAHLPGDPWLTIHNNIEGNINYTNLLFIPSNKPFDLFHPDRMTRVKLYVKKVFITESNVQLIPRYLRFLYGVIDSPDIPLNISRETLQDDVIIGKIRDLITKKVISELKTKMEKDFDSYTKFWINFGAVLKEGLCEHLSDRDSLLDLCIFKTSSSNGEFVSLKTYIDRMKDVQNDIYYCIADEENPESNPQIEGFIKKGIEVLYLTDHVDTFWTTVIFDYAGKNIKSINRADIDLSLDNAKTDEEKNKNHDQNEKMVKLFEEALNGMVKNVIISRKLTDSAACISLPEGAMDIKMERFLIAQGQLKNATLKMLEINPDNPLIIKAFKELEAGNTKGKDMAFAVFEIACVAQDEGIKNPSKFAKRLFDLLSS